MEDVYKRQVKFILEDEGPGIEDDVKSRIFDKFYQVDGSHKAEGNGLGLAPVSYTHLDVYKRQVLASGKRSRIICA